MKKGEGRKNWEQKTERREQIYFKSQATENYVMTEQREFVLKIETILPCSKNTTKYRFNLLN